LNLGRSSLGKEIIGGVIDSKFNFEGLNGSGLKSGNIIGLNGGKDGFSYLLSLSN
jgi:hypothetical protein